MPIPDDHDPHPAAPQPVTPPYWTPDRIHSWIAIGTPIVGAIITAVTPAIQDFLNHNKAVAALLVIVTAIWNNTVKSAVK